MADLKISQLPALAEADLAATDELAVVDGSASETKKITAKALVEKGVALIDAASIPASAVAGLSANSVVTASITDGDVTNIKLANSSLSLGGVSIALGATDATPAFNLTDATNYPASSLTGTLSNSQLANSSVSLGGVSINLGATDATPAFNLTDATGYKTTELVGTITNAQLAGSIDASKLVGSNISLGGVTIALGGTDATPAFNLVDATGYPTSSLTGTITNAQLAGSIANSKLVNSSVSFGGISVALGAADATPAFDLSDATSYPTSALVGTITNAQLAGSIANSKLTNSAVSFGGVSVSLGGTDATPAFNLTDATGYPASALVGTITDAQLAGSIAGTKLVSGSITSTQLGANSVTDSELANNAVDTGALQNGAITNDKVETSTSATTGLDGATKIRDASITPAKLNTSNLDRSLNVASGNLGINNAVSGGAATRSGITYNAQGLITGTVALAAADLPVSTASAVGGVSIGTGLTVNGAGALSITNSVTGATVSGITFNAQGMITAATALVAANLPTATTSAKGAVQITAGGGLTVSGSGGLTTSTSGISAGTYTKLTVNTKGVATAGTVLVASDIPDLAASKITSGSIDAARIGADTIDGTKLSNSSTTIFGSVGQTGFPTSQFTGQFFFDSVTEDLYIFDGNAYQPVTTLTKGSLVLGGTFNANTSQVASVTTAGAAAGLAVGSNVPTPSSSTDGLYLVVELAGTPSAPAPVVALSPPDYILGVTNTSGSSWEEIDLSQTVAGQVASNITFTPYGQLAATNVQDALQELETEKMGFGGGTLTGQLLVGNTGSLVFEGSSIDAYETTIGVTNPTASDKTILFPDVSGNVITSGDTNTVTSTMVDGSLVNANLAANAAIALSKLAAVNSAQIIVGNGSNVATAVAVTGDIGINNAGLTSITAGAIVNADVNASAAIAGSKITTGTTSAVGVLQLTDATNSTSTTTAATPNSVKTAFDLATTANTNAANAAQTTGSTFTGNVIIDNGKELRLSESDSDGANYTGLKVQAQSGDITLTLPAVAPTANQVLKADASTPTTLTWATDAATDATKMPLSGGTFTGDVTFTGDSSNGLWDKSASAFVANLTGNVTGNASTATTLATARAINGVNFDGSAPITITAAAGTLTGTELKSTVVTSSLTSVGTLTGLTSTGDINLNDQADLRFKDADSSHYVALQSPGTIASSFTLTLPSTDAAVSGYVLASDGSGTLSWVDPGSSSSPTFTGDATLTNDGALVGFSNLNATYTGNTKTLTVTVATKTGAHRYNGSGSSSGYKIDGKEAPFLTLTPGRTYKFDQAHSSNATHPLRFYLDAAGASGYNTGVTTSGTPGSSGAYTQLVVSDTTPQVLHYQCNAHQLMGNSVQTNSNAAQTAFSANNVVVTDESTTNAFVYPTFFGNGSTTNGTGDLSTDASFVYTPSTGELQTASVKILQSLGSGSAAPLTIDGSSHGGTKIELKGAPEPRITYYENTTLKAYLIWQATAGEFYIQNNEHSNILSVGTTPRWSANLGTSWSEMLHQGNVGSGQALASVGIHASSLALATTLSVAGVITMTGTEGIHIAAGTTGQRSGSPNAGTFRFNTTTSKFEGYFGSAWAEVGGGDVVDDTSPQLGGDLDTNNENIIFGDSSDGTSNDVLKFGVGVGGVPDLSIYSNGSEGIFETGTGGDFKFKVNNSNYIHISGSGSGQIDFYKHVTFQGSGSNAAWDYANGRFSGTITEVLVTANNSTDETCYPLFADGATGSQGAESDTGLTYNPSTGALTSTKFIGAATALDGSRTIGGVVFDNTGNINLPGVNAAGNQDTSGTAALATEVTVTANNSTDETVYPLFADGATGSQGAETDTGLTYNPSTGLLTAAQFSGDGTALTDLDASNIGHGYVPSARLAASPTSSKFLRGDQTWQSIPTTSPAGSNSYIQYNASGTFGASNTLIYSGNLLQSHYGFQDQHGFLRDVPSVSISNNTTVNSSYRGRCCLASNNFYVGTAAAGYVVSVINTSGSDITINRSTSYLYNTASGDNNSSYTFASRGMLTLFWTASSTVYMSGSGIS